VREDTENLRAEWRSEFSDLGGQPATSGILGSKPELSVVSKISPFPFRQCEMLFQDRFEPVVIRKLVAVNSSFAAGCAPIGKDVLRWTMNVAYLLATRLLAAK
jgi:hypothetical protein